MGYDLDVGYEGKEDQESFHVLGTCSGQSLRWLPAMLEFTSLCSHFPLRVDFSSDSTLNE